MTTFKKILLTLYIITLISYVSFGIYRIIIFGFSSGKELFAQMTPIVLGFTTFYILYERFIKKSNAK